MASLVPYVIAAFTGVLWIAGPVLVAARGLVGLWLYLLLQAVLLLGGGIQGSAVLVWLIPLLAAGPLSLLLEQWASSRYGRPRHALTEPWLVGLAVGIAAGAATRPALGMAAGGALAGLPAWNFARDRGMGALAALFAGTLLRLAAALLGALAAVIMITWLF